MTGRAEEIAAGLDAVRRRIADACTAAGRQPDEVSLTVVTKFFPAADVELLAGLGVDQVGENKHQEGAAKHAEVTADLRWHFIGTLQSNKATAVTGWADVVESVDRPKLLTPLARGAQERGRDLDCLVQVSLDPPGQRGSRAGVAPEDALALARRVASTEGLRLRGVMAVAPPDEDAAGAFARLAQVAGQVQREEPSATWISAGMSADLEAAVAAGATHVRIGTAVLGPRPPIK